MQWSSVQQLLVASIIGMFYVEFSDLMNRSVNGGRARQSLGRPQYWHSVVRGTLAADSYRPQATSVGAVAKRAHGT
jgi:hypothetical protein